MFTFSGTSIRTKLATAAVVAAGALALPAMSSATTVSPAGQAFTASTGSTTFVAGPSVTCTSSQLVSAVPASPSNSNPGGTVSTTGVLSFSGCSSTIPGTTTTVTNCTVTGVADYNGGSPTLAIQIPSNCIRISIKTVLTTCTITINPQTVTGSYNNTTYRASYGPLSIPFSFAGVCPGVSSPATWSKTGGGAVVYQVDQPVTIGAP